ncbi:hypothetical protein Rhe02_38020 [Rhizocola hellebori]|uniref:Uncharacterized protein n=2 Tax=Rhizocola hellebori TaxID=1392758 RepID=A0A8J3Q9W8_9ACTN|nr:hypothetical protein Rhe02_38020 [Rhizocola hellebori]
MFWDDGKSIAKDSAKPPPAHGNDLSTWLSFTRTYEVEVHAGKRPLPRRDINSRELFGLEKNSPLQVLQSISPFTDGSESLPGGLEVLANSVLDVFSGEMEVVTSNLRVVISANPKTQASEELSRARAVIEVDPEGSVAFWGNLLILRIPLAR